MIVCIRQVSLTEVLIYKIIIYHEKSNIAAKTLQSFIQGGSALKSSLLYFCKYVRERFSLLCTFY